VPLYPPQIPPDPGRRRRGGKPATNRLSYGMALDGVQRVFDLVSGLRARRTYKNESEHSYILGGSEGR
jgi:hypothetical protein